MAEAETLYSARQLADELGLTLQMLSKYAQAYTKLTKQQIMKKGRDGRHFTSAQREVIKNARDMVRLNTGVTVEDALKRALVYDAVPVEVGTGAVGAAVDLEALQRVFGAALRDEVTAPLVKELQSLKAEIEELKDSQDLRVTKQIDILTAKIENLAESTPVADQGKALRQHGPLVKFSVWFESLLRR